MVTVLAVKVITMCYSYVAVSNEERAIVQARTWLQAAQPTLATYSVVLIAELVHLDGLILG